MVTKVLSIFVTVRRRPTLTIDEVTGRPTFSLDIRPSEGRETLKQIFEYLGQSGKRCYIAIDEFQQILDFPESGVEALSVHIFNSCLTCILCFPAASNT